MTEVGRLPKRIDLRLYAGDTAAFTFTLSDVDTAAGQWAAQIKIAGATDSTEEFTVTLDPETPGQAVLSLAADASQRLGVFGKKRLRWDLQQTFDDSTVTTHAQGDVLVTPDVTPIPDLSAVAPVVSSTALFTEAGEKLLTESGDEMVA